MRRGPHSILIPFALIALSSSLQAQDVRSTSLAVGSRPGQIGLVAAPNEECRGPITVTPASDGRLAILDWVNRKIVVVGGSTPQDVPLPRDLVEPTDFIATTRGFIVLGALGDVAMVDEKGAVLARIDAKHDPETGTLRLVALPGGRLALEDLRGNRIPVNLDPALIGDLVLAGLATAGSYTRTTVSPNQVILTTTAISSIALTSRMRIVDARAVWVSEGEGALIAVQESRELPEEAAFVRLVTLDGGGQLKGETYLGPEAFACGTRRPFARLTDGRVVALAFREKNELGRGLVSAQPQAH